MANIKVAVTHKSQNDGGGFVAFAKTVVLIESAIDSVLPEGSGSLIIMKNGVRYKSAQTVNAVGAGITDTALT